MDSPRSSTRRWMLRAASILMGTIAPLAALEAVLRTLPVFGGVRTARVDESNPVIRFEPNRSFVWSRDWNFSIVNTVTTNNYGFVSDFDYEPRGQGPLLGVIGDSYVEAFQVPFRQSCAGRLATLLHDAARVYPFGVSGSALSQYLAFAEYARDTFHPDGLLVLVIDNDYDESLVKYGREAGQHQFAERGGGLVLERTDFEPSPVYWLLRRSALGRYLAGNLGVRIGWSTGETESRASAAPERRIADSKRAVEVFLDRLPASSGLPPERIAFVVDGLRPEVYSGRRDGPGRDFRHVMHRHFTTSAAARGYETLDLHPVFLRHFERHGARFEWPTDNHWNEAGHAVCFRAAAESRLVAGIRRLAE